MGEDPNQAPTFLCDAMLESLIAQLDVPVRRIEELPP